jgi:glycosyltransferase involved in cell wall biosynthesis
MNKVSVVIPCFNQGAYLPEAVDSVLAQTFRDIEIIIVDDGSDDPETIRILNQYEKGDVKLIRTSNKGLAAARNRGIREATGKYILPLDADDKIGKGYASDAVSILDEHPDIGIVYCEAVYFGLKNERWLLPEFSLDHIIRHNIIFCSAFFRKEDWEAVGGYNINMVYGWEDWDFWLSLIGLQRKVYRIPKIFFHYRLRETSMVRSIDEEKDFFMRLHVCLNHRALFRQVANIEINVKIAELFFDTGFGFHHHQSMKSIVFADQREISFDLSPYPGIKRLRFDPINTRAFLHLREIGITQPDGVFHPLPVTEHNAVERRGDDFLFDTEDPQIYLDIEHVKDPCELIVRGQFFSIGTEVFAEIVRCKEEAITTLTEEKNLLERDLSAELQRLERDLSAERGTICALRAELQRLERDLSAERETICALGAEVQRLKHDLAGTQSVLANREEVIDGMIRSASWRLTKPLRTLRRIITRFGKGT